MSLVVSQVVPTKVTINTERFSESFFEDLFFSIDEDYEKMLKRLYQPISKEVPGFKKNTEEFIQLKSNLKKLEQLVEKKELNSARKVYNIILENLNALNWDTSGLKEDGIYILTKEQFKETIKVIKKLLNQKNDLLAPIIKELVKAYNEKTGFPNPKNVDITYDTTPLKHIGFWSNLFYQEGISRKLGHEYCTDYDIIVFYDNIAYVRLSYYFLAKLFGKRITKVFPKLIFSYWKDKMKWEKAFNEIIHPFISQSNPLWKKISNTAINKRISSDDKASLKNNGFLLKANDFAGVIKEFDFLKDVQVKFEEPEEVSDSIKNELNKAFGKGVDIKLSGELIGSTKKEVPLKQVRQELAKKDIKLDITPLKWAAPGACGLTCVRMILSYLNKLPRISLEGYELGSLDKGDAQLALILLKTLKNLDKEVVKKALKDRIDSELKSIARNNNIIGNNLVGYILDFKNLRELLILLSITLNKEVYKSIPESDDLRNNLLESLKKAKKQEGLPPLMLTNYGSGGGEHFVLITGLEGDEVIYNDPEGEEKRVNINEITGQNNYVVNFLVLKDENKDYNKLLIKIESQGL